MDGKMEEWMERWMDGWMGWIGRCMGWLDGWRLDRWGGKAGKHRSFHLSRACWDPAIRPSYRQALPYSLMRTDKLQCSLQK